ncbi:MAG: type II toxin-antitoxin system VapC family toxin [Devosia sp.]
MIAVDTSALMAVLLQEPEASACATALQNRPPLMISAGTVAEALIVAQHRQLGAAMKSLVTKLDFEIIPFTAAVAYQAGEANRIWGKGIHPAGLNYGDCFAYVTAKEFDCPLLYVGNDFGKTDVKRVL